MIADSAGPSTSAPSPPGEAATFRLHRRSLVAPVLTLCAWLAYGGLAAAGTVAFDGRSALFGFAAIVRIMMVFTMRVAVSDEQIRARWGWIWHSDKSIPIRRVQDVEIERSLTARILGLTQVEITSAGGSGSIKLSYLDLPDATRLKSLLARRGLGARTGTDVEVGGVAAGDRSLRSVSVSEILRTQYATAFVMAVVALVSVIAGVTVNPLALLGVVGAGAFLGFGALTTWLGYGTCESSLSGELLHLRQGVIKLRTTNTPLRRVQVLKARSGPVYQMLDFEKVEYASAEASVGKQQRIRQVLSPAADVGTLLPFTSALLEVGLPNPLLLTQLGPVVFRSTVWRALIRSVIALAVGAAIAFEVAAIIVAADPHHRVGDVIAVALVVGIVALVIAALPVVASMAVGAVRSRRSGYAFGEDCFVVRDGFAWLRTTVVPLSKIQAVDVTESPGQRIVGAATVALDVAGVSGKWTLRVVDVTQPMAEALAEKLVAAACLRSLPDGV